MWNNAEWIPSLHSDLDIVGVVTDILIWYAMHVGQNGQ